MFNKIEFIEEMEYQQETYHFWIIKLHFKFRLKLQQQFYFSN